MSIRCKRLVPDFVKIHYDALSSVSDYNLDQGANSEGGVEEPGPID